MGYVLVHLYHLMHGMNANSNTRRPAAGSGSPSRPARLRAGRDTFATEGVIAWLDECHRERFNFEQAIWLEPTVAMGSRTRRESEVLAVNILTRLIPTRNVRALVGVTSKQAIRLAPLFVTECLAARDPEWTRWTMPIEALRAWLASHREPARTGTSL